MAACRQVPASKLPIGAKLRSPIADPQNPNVRLLTAGVTITASFLEKLAARGITSVVVSQRDLAIMNTFKPQGRRTKVPPPHHYVQSLRVNDHTKEIDKLVHSDGALEIDEIESPLAEQIQRPVDCPYADGLTNQWAADNDRQVETLGEFFDDTVNGSGAQVEPLREHCLDILDRLSEDPDALVCLAGAPYESEYPSRHAVHVASMAIAIGVEMGLDKPNLIDLGIGCLIHDIGMQKVGVAQFQNRSTVTAGHLRQLADHPVHTVEIAGKFAPQISTSSRMVAYQIHERLDGSGYPRGRPAEKIHPLARIAAVADSLVGMLSPRPHRLGIQGYYAIKQLLEDTKEGKFDPRVVRALLRVTSLYPIGSCVDLSNQHIGRVIRAGGSQYDKPTIEMWSSDDLGGTPSIVNLQEETSVQITRSIPSFDAA